MANLLRRLRGEESRYSLVDWMADKAESFSFAGVPYSTRGDETGDSLLDFMGWVRQSPPAFGAQLTRSLILSQARFRFRELDSKRLFDTPALGLLERPWPKGTTGELLTKAEWHAGVAGNAFIRREPSRLRLLRPDRVGIILGSMLEPDDPAAQLDAEVLGFAYWSAGMGIGRPEVLLAEDVAHWSPLPDPLCAERGMSWVASILREIQGDVAATRHKLQFFRNGATPNLVVTGVPGSTPQQFAEMVDALESQHTGIDNAYRTIYLTAGADATVVGANLKDLDYRVLQGVSETRISVASRVPAPILGISEGLAGSALNAGNYGQARRNFADGWLYPTLQSLVAAIAQIVPAPPGSELWFDTSDMPFVREDESDAAEIRQKDALTLRALVDAGFDADSAVAFVQSSDLAKLMGAHSGLFSVQLQQPGVSSGRDGAPQLDGTD